MEIRIEWGHPLEQVVQVLVVGCFEKELTSPWLAEIDAALAGCITALYRQGEFTGKANKTVMIHTLGRTGPERILLVGLGMRQDFTPERLRQAAGSAMQALRGAGIQRAASLLHLVQGEGEQWLRAALEGFLLAGYSFDRYKTRGPDNPGNPVELILLVPEEQGLWNAEAVAEEARVLCQSVHFARELVDQPGNVATPAFLAEQALEVSERYGISCRILEREEMETLGMEALLAVAKGSCQSPRLITMEYLGGKQGQRPTVLVGKGVTFDSGGISLKPREGMEKMKNDMAGGAAVLGTMAAAARLKLPVNLIGLVAAAENLPGGRAFKPGDVLKSMAGHTIEIVNTDAEGRLVLCDTLHYAQRYNPAALIDVATLTGACVVALGSFATGFMATDQDLAKRLRRAAEATGEKVWELPVWDEYGELMKSDIADFKNAGGPTAGASSAAWFLRQFVGKTRWAHLDIAGTAWEEKGRPYLPKGATGVGVRLLIEYLRG